MDLREQKGLEIAAKAKLTQQGGRWLVPSQSKGSTASGDKRYVVKPDVSDPQCNCPDHEIRRVKCKHIWAVEYTILREYDYSNDGQTVTQKVTETVTVKKTYQQDWPAYNAAQTNEKDQFQSLLHQLCQGIGEPSQKIGRPRLAFEDMIFSACFKVYSTVSGRRFMTDLREAQKKGYISKVPHYNSVFNYFENEALTPYLEMLIEESSLPLAAIESDFAVDSSGFSTSRFVQWVNAKYTNRKLLGARDWVKINLMCGVKTNIVTAVTITDRFAGDSPQFKPLVEATAKNFVMQEVSADKAYLSKDNLQVVVDNHAMPYIPFKSNSKPSLTWGIGPNRTTSARARWKEKGSLWRQMYHYYEFNHKWFMQQYHKRSNVESTFSMIKAKFGDALRSRTDTAQVNEALCKVLCHNICVVIQSMFELNIKPEFWTTEPLQVN
jgi:DDE family transposase/SWIM zinc finger